jgi:stage II sporulation protein AA (anti-sigma F factor antagonist)
MKRREGTIVGLQILIRESGGVAILDLRGTATIGSQGELLSRQLQELMAHGVRNLLLNLADLTQIDSSGVSTIVETHVALRRSGGSLALLRPSGRVLIVLKVIHLLEIIPNFEDEAEALASFEPRGYSATPGGRP